MEAVQRGDRERRDGVSAGARATHDRRAETISRNFWGGVSISRPLRRRVIEAMTELITRLFAFTIVLLLAAAALLAALAELGPAVRRAHS
ncbi:MAG TPA: hypothetical protein VHP33_30820 [Polyangiaceae bacterium]|nr:hypothetical protein [Polyangiaceae bacterium]